MRVRVRVRLRLRLRLRLRERVRVTSLARAKLVATWLDKVTGSPLGLHMPHEVIAGCAAAEEGGRGGGRSASVASTGAGDCASAVGDRTSLARSVAAPLTEDACRAASSEDAPLSCARRKASAYAAARDANAVRSEVSDASAARSVASASRVAADQLGEPLAEVAPAEAAPARSVVSASSVARARARLECTLLRSGSVAAARGSAGGGAAWPLAARGVGVEVCHESGSGGIGAAVRAWASIEWDARAGVCRVASTTTGGGEAGADHGTDMMEEPRGGEVVVFANGEHVPRICCETHLLQKATWFAMARAAGLKPPAPIW